VNRRGFLATLGAGLALNPERLLWVPGKKLISIPKPISTQGWTVSDSVTVTEFWFRIPGETDWAKYSSVNGVERYPYIHRQPPFVTVSRDVEVMWTQT